jgi:hypothetical protein
MFRFISTLNQPTPYYNKLLLYLYFHSKGIIIIVLEYTNTIIIIVYIIIQVSKTNGFSFISFQIKSPLREVSLRTIQLLSGHDQRMLILGKIRSSARKKVQFYLVVSKIGLGFSFIHYPVGEISGGRDQIHQNIYIDHTKTT